jgi:hypothetical protein
LKKQRDAESRQLVQSNPTTNTLSSASYNGAQLAAPLEKALTYGADKTTSNSTSSSEEIQRLQESLAEKEKKWRAEYEKLIAENETLKGRAGEATLAAQWRTRYEVCLKEKDELAEKLALYTRLSQEFNGSGDGETGSAKGSGVDLAFADMQSSLKVLHHFLTFRKVSHALLRAHQLHESSFIGGAAFYPGGRITPSTLPSTSSSSSSSSSSASASVSNANEAKIQYIRQMVYQYLTCRELEVKQHIEAALIAIFRLNEQERSAIEVKRKEEAQDTLSSITSFLGEAFSLSTT